MELYVFYVLLVINVDDNGSNVLGVWQNKPKFDELRDHLAYWDCGDDNKTCDDIANELIDLQSCYMYDSGNTQYNLDKCTMK